MPCYKLTGEKRQISKWFLTPWDNWSEALTVNWSTLLWTLKGHSVSIVNYGIPNPCAVLLNPNCLIRLCIYCFLCYSLVSLFISIYFFGQQLSIVKYKTQTEKLKNQTLCNKILWIYFRFFKNSVMFRNTVKIQRVHCVSAWFYRFVVMWCLQLQRCRLGGFVKHYFFGHS